MKNKIAVIILAAGKSTRMKSGLPKALHPICGRPMFTYVLDSIKGIKADRVIAVLGHRQEEVRKLIIPGIKIVIQKKLIGTADAVKQAFRALNNFKGTILVLYADNPLLSKETIKRLLNHHAKNKADATVLTALLGKPGSYGRILRDRYANISGIIEEKDADDFQKEIKEINTGIFCFNKDILGRALKDIKANNRKKEYYLTDAIAIIYKAGGLIEGLRLKDINEALGINSRSDLAKADKVMRGRINERLMKEGVSIIDPDSTFISYGVKIGIDTTIYPFTVIERNVKIGKRCSLGPFIHLRQGTELSDDTILGNFLEAVRTRFGKNTIAKHFCYLGDSRIGKNVNIGAGTVTANFDGKKKNISTIKDSAFIGSDSVLVAPVEIGKGALTGAGSVVVKKEKVPNGAVVVGVPARILKRKGKKDG